MKRFALFFFVLSIINSPLWAETPANTRLIIQFNDAAAGTKHKLFLHNRLEQWGLQFQSHFNKLRTMGDGAQLVTVDKDGEQLDQLLADINASPSVAYAEIDRWVTPSQLPNDTRFAEQWSLGKDYPGSINMPEAWDIATGDKNLVIAVVDTGVRPHPDFVSRLVSGYDFISTTDVSNDGDGRDGDPTDPGDGTTSQDFCGPSASTWHGTHVTGIIAAEANNNEGIAGVNWHSKILPLRVMGRCGGYMSDIADAIRWAAGLSVQGVPTNPNPAKVINLSLGAGGACGKSEGKAINEAVSTGAVVVVAAGNAGGDVANSSPASCDNVITVTAVTQQGAKAYYANSGEEVDIAAPGGGNVGILSTYNSGYQQASGDIYSSLVGTSMAAPHVSGVASLMLSLAPTLTPAEIESLLKQTAKKFPTGTQNDCTTSSCGSGILDAKAALLAVADNLPPIVKVMSDTRANPGTQVQLTASAKDPEGKTLKFSWKQLSGTNVTINAVDKVDANFIAPISGDLRFRLTVIDSEGLSASDELTVVVNQRPTADAGLDSAVAVSSKFVLNGSGSRDDLAIAQYQWQQLSGSTVSLSNPSVRSPAFIAPAIGGELAFRLTVIDGEGLQHSDDVLIKVSQAPIANAGIDIKVNPGETVTLSGIASKDNDGSIVDFVWYQREGSGVTLQNPHSAVVSFVAPSNPGVLSFELVVRDNVGLLSSDLVSVYVNAAPQIIVDGPSIGSVGDTINLSVANSVDVDGKIVSYTWQQVSGPVISLTNNSGEQSSFDLPDAKEFIVLRVEAKDDMGLVASRDVEIQINQAPTASVAFPEVVNPGETIVLDASRSSDPNDNIAAYRWSQSSGMNVALSVAEGKVTRFLVPDQKGDLSFRLDVVDDFGLSSEQQIRIHINEKPIIVVDSERMVNAGSWVILDATQSYDADGSIQSYRWTQVSGTPVGLMDRNSVLAGFNAPMQGGRLEFVLHVADDHQLVNEQQITIAINAPPVAIAGNDLRVEPGTTVQLSAADSSDADGDALQYLWQQASGDAVVLSQANSELASFVAPSKSGVLQFRLRVTDQQGQSDYDDINVLVGGGEPLLTQHSMTAAPGEVLRLSEYVTATDNTIFWRQLSGTVVDIISAGNAFNLPYKPGRLLLEASTKDRVDLLEVEVINVAPLVDIPEKIKAKPFEDVVFDVDVHDDNGTKPSLEVIDIPQGANFDKSTGHFQWTDKKASGDYTFIVAITDGDDSSVVVYKSVEISIRNTGNVRFSSKELTLNEYEGNIFIPVLRQGGNEGERRFKVKAVYELANEDDAVVMTKGVYWADGEDDVQSVVLSLVNDVIGEGSENLRIQLIDSDDKVEDELQVYIIDDDVYDNGIIDFKNANTSVNEGDGFAYVSVARNGGVHGEVRILYKTIDDGASSGKDYEDTEGELYWADGEDGERIIQIPIRDDEVGENDERLKLQLESMGIVNVANRETTVVIKDNDPTCFIATAAYGTGMHKEVRYLRAFRDEFLLTNSLGRKFVETYYHYSPPIADYLRQNSLLKSAVRVMLEPLIALSEWLVSDESYAAQTANKR